MKRGRAKDQLTGGSGDVNPQILTFTSTQSGVDATTVQQITLPIPRLPTREGYNLVMEILNIDYYHMTPNPVGNAQQATYIGLSTSSSPSATAALAIQDPRVLDAWVKYVQFGATPDVGYIPVEQETDLTDNAGHGLIVATDTLFVHQISTGTGVANQYTLKIWYRWKVVSLIEYIGVVQSQQ
jgi:hypothetical protein